MKDMNVKKTVSLSEEEMKKVLGGDAANYQLHCMQMMGGHGCTGYCEPRYDFHLGHTVKEECKQVGVMPPNEDGEYFSQCACL